MRIQFQLVALLAATIALVISLSLLLLAPPGRIMGLYQASLQVRLADGSVLVGRAQKRKDNDDLPLTDGYIYAFAQATTPAREAAEVELFALPSANADALQLPQKFGPRALFAGDKRILLTVRPNKSSARNWVEGRQGDHLYFGARISADGSYQITRHELWRARLREWENDPAHLLRWLFTSEQIVDRRGLWLQLWSSSDAASENETKDLWQQALRAFSANAPALFARGAKDRLILVRHPEAGEAQ